MRLRLASILSFLAASLAAQTGPSSSVDLEILTWNILHGTNDRGELNLESKGQYLAELSADLVFLQEIDENCDRTGRVDQMKLLAQITGLDAAFGSFMPFQGGRYGLGTLSALPVQTTRALRLPEGDEPRVALMREVEVLGRTVLTVNVHLNWTEDDTSRYAQARALLAEIEAFEVPMIIAGDFNDIPESRSMQAFYDAGFEPVEESGPSWNARVPSVDIDHILVRSGPRLLLEPVGGGVLVEEELSDHRPVRGQIRAVVKDK